MSNPSPAAIRAAIAIHANGIPKIAAMNIEDFPDHTQAILRGRAAIIDRETALPELVEAAKTTRRDLMILRDIIENVGHQHVGALKAALLACDALYDGLAAALAKVEADHE